jgi:hypothetical protein
MDSSISPKDEIWFLRVCHHISKAVYQQIHNLRARRPVVGSTTLFYTYMIHDNHFVSMHGSTDTHIPELIANLTQKYETW